MPGWDGTIVREGATVSNDAAFMGFLAKAGAISPADLSRPDALRSMGLAALGGF